MNVSNLTVIFAICEKNIVPVATCTSLNQRWEFIKENKNSNKKAIKKLRKQERKQELDQDSDQESKKTRKITRTRPRKRPRKKYFFFRDHFLCRVLVILLSCFLL